MKIVYWSDYACPYCYIGETRLKKAIKEHLQENTAGEDAHQCGPEGCRI